MQKKTRDKMLCIKVNERELKAIKEKALEKQLTTSEYVRNMAIYGEVK